MRGSRLPLAARGSLRARRALGIYPRVSGVRGYDFESGGRRIELKGRSRPEPAIDLTRTQYQTLSDEAYYVYVVADALRHPVLRVVRGPKLLGLVPEPTFRYADWRRIATPRRRRTGRRAMPSRAELEEAVRSCASARRASVVEALYVLSLCAGQWLAKANLRLRMRRSKPRRALHPGSSWCGEPTRYIPSKASRDGRLCERSYLNDSAATSDYAQTCYSGRSAEMGNVR